MRSYGIGINGRDLSLLKGTKKDDMGSCTRASKSFPFELS